MVHCIYTHPIVISRGKTVRERTAFDFFASERNRACTKLAIATGRVMDIVRHIDHKYYPERGAVWFNYEMITSYGSFSVMDKTGNAFPDDDFERNCRFNCLEKSVRTINSNLTCSHQNRNPANGLWGGSARLEFDFVGERHHVSVIIVGACSGRKEWEDLAITLGAYHHVGLVNFDNPQVQSILQLAESAVADDPQYNPPDGITISEYVKKVFTGIDASPSYL